jgi:cytochrome c oxidase subunit 2
MRKETVTTSDDRSGAAPAALAAERWLLPLIIWLLPVVTLGLGMKTWLPPLASDHGAGIDRMLRYLLLSVGALYVIGNGVLGYFVWRFCRQGKVTLRMASRKSERRWSIIAIGVMLVVAEGGVFVLGLPVWGKYFGEPPANVLTVEVTAEQFAWNVRYPGVDGKFGRTAFNLISLDNPIGLDRSDESSKDDIVLLNDIHLPVNQPARIRLHAKDVIHSFYVPDFRVRQDAVPGMTIDLWFMPTKTGSFELACSQLCGFGHYTMRGLVTVVSDAEFKAWLTEQASYN